ncbi:MAG TPA: hypothetical protein VG937_15145 [Polyangiaceae bacterium]|nr:hypothetical protein [Polyangiaceae bacterium]
MPSLWSLALCLPLLACNGMSVASTSPPPLAQKRAPLNPVVENSSARDAAPLPVAKASGRERCPDEILPRGAEADLAVRVEDARVERRDLLPLDLSTALRSESSEQSARPRYLAELLVDGYSAPRLFRRLNAPRSEWAAGSLQGRLVVHDLSEHRILCQVSLRAKGNADGAPIRRRLREDTRRSLERKLYGRVRDAMETALGSISSVLRLARGVPSEPAARGS